MLPVSGAVEVGVNETLNEIFAPAVMVFGSARPVIPKPVPETVARFTVRRAFPLLVSVTFCELVCPTVTLLKSSEEGEIVKAGCMPVPLSAIASGEFEASLVTVRVPFAAPKAVGANCIWTVMLCPTGIDAEGLPPMTVNPAPEMVAAERFTIAVPAFVTVTLCVAVLPTATLPNATLAEFAESTPALPVLPLPAPPPLPPNNAALVVYPEQLDNPAKARITVRAVRKDKSLPARELWFVNWGTAFVARVGYWLCDVIFRTV
jgi:hypothetical protein